VSELPEHLPEVCPTCGHAKAAPAKCHAKAKTTGKRYGAGGGRPATKFRYAAAIDKNPELKRAYDKLRAAGVDEFDLSDEILLARARLHAAIESGTVELKTLNELQRDLIKAIQKNLELRIKVEGLVQRKDAEQMLRSAVSVITKFVPDHAKDACMTELRRVLTAGNSLFGDAAGGPPALEAGHE
jgi:hypothetical protein